MGVCMFERFTTANLTAFRVAERMAFDLETQITPDHVLRGLLNDPDALTVRILRVLGMDVDDYLGRCRVEPVLNHEVRPKFSAETRAVMEEALRTALRLGHDYIAGAHFLLALHATQTEFRELFERNGVTQSGLEREAMRFYQNLMVGWLSGFEDDRPLIQGGAPHAGVRSIVLLQGDDIGPDTAWFRWWLDDADAGPDTWSYKTSTRRSLLSEWESALPTPLPDENLGDALDRSVAGPLSTPKDERALMARLGYAMLPSHLTAEILSRRAQGIEVEVRILPPPSCASIAWSLVALADSPRFSDGPSRPRLGEIADVVADVPAAFHVGRGRVPYRTSEVREVVRVIDPRVRDAGRLFTDAQRALLSPTGDFASGSHVDPVSLATRLTAGPDVDALVFVGHVTQKDASMHLSSPSAIAAEGMSASVGRGRLSAADLVMGSPRGQAGPRTGPEIWPMPPRVAIVACHSGSDLARREPFGLVMACLNGGAEWVIATQWVLPADRRFRDADDLLDDDPQPLFHTVVMADSALLAVDPGVGLATAIRERIRVWESLPADVHAPGESPLTWGALTAFRAPQVDAQPVVTPGARPTD